MESWQVFFWQAGKAWLSGLFYRKRYGAAVPILIQGAGFLLVIVPAVYSIFLLRFFEKRGENAAWKEKVKVMGSAFINTVMALLGLLCFNYMLDGHSMEECRIVFEESFASIGWESGLLSIALMYFYILHNKTRSFQTSWQVAEIKTAGGN